VKRLRFLWISPDIRNRLLISFALLAIYRLTSHVPVPGVNRAAIAQIFTQTGAGQALFGLLDLLSGGTVSTFSVLAMGVYPYITAQIILQVLVPIIPALQRRMEEDPREGRKWMEKWTYFLAIPMAACRRWARSGCSSNSRCNSRGVPVSWPSLSAPTCPPSPSCPP
jgi:preprotein translocase subunit SecY